MIKNEADIIESFVRYNANIFDGMVILDNGSTDNTLNILNGLIQEGYSIQVLHDDTVQYNQDVKTNKLLKYTFDMYNPDIIMPLDADEFVVCNQIVNPRVFMEKLDPDKVHYIRWKTYVPNQEDNTEELFIPKRIRHAREDKLDTFYKVIITKEVINSFKIELTMGNHDVRVGTNTIISPEALKHDVLRLAHFPVRSLDQIISKSIVGWSNYLSTPDRGKTSGKQWEDLYIKFKENHNINYSDLIDIGKNYAVFTEVEEISSEYDILDTSFCSRIDIKYTSKKEINIFKNILNNYENIIDKYVTILRDSSSAMEYQKYLKVNQYIQNINDQLSMSESLEGIKFLVAHGDVDSKIIIRCIENLPNNKHAVYNLVAQHFFNSGLTDYIIPLLYQSLKINNRDTDTLYNLGYVLYRFGEYKQAISYLEQIDNKDDDVKNLINDILVNL